MTKTKLREKWYEAERRRKWQVKKWRGKIYKVLKSQWMGYAAAYAEKGFTANPDTLILSQDILRPLVALALDVGVREAKMSYLEVKRDSVKIRASIGFDEEFAAEIIRILGDDFLILSVGINEVTKELILQIIRDGVQEGLGQREIARRIVEESGILRNRANLIARTEVLRSANEGRMTGARKTGLKLKKIWSSAQQFRTRGSRAKDRADHRTMNGQEREFDEPFQDPRNNALLNQPGDASLNAPGESTINCRCAVVFEAQKDSQGNLIRA